MAIQRNGLIKIASLLAIITTANAFNSGRGGGYGNIQDNDDFNDRRTNRPTQQNNLINLEKKELGRDKEELVYFFERAGEVIGNELIRGSSNDRIWSVYDQLKREVKRTRWYSRLEQNVGQEDIEFVFRTFQRKIRSQISKARANYDRVNTTGGNSGNKPFRPSY